MKVCVCVVFMTTDLFNFVKLALNMIKNPAKNLQELFEFKKFLYHNEYACYSQRNEYTYVHYREIHMLL